MCFFLYLVGCVVVAAIVGPLSCEHIPFCDYRSTASTQLTGVAIVIFAHVVIISTNFLFNPKELKWLWYSRNRRR